MGKGKVNYNFVMQLSEIIIPFLTIALAELGDKSQILVFLLSSRTKRHLDLLAGVMLGFLIVDGFAILVGGWVVQLIPAFTLKIISGLIFLVLGTLMLLTKNKDENQKEPPLKNPLVTGFLMIFMAEWGDKTQIASALFATKYNSYMVLFSVMSALFLLSVSAIYLGKIISHRINKNLTTKISGLIFIILGLLSL